MKTIREISLSLLVVITGLLFIRATVVDDDIVVPDILKGSGSIVQREIDIEEYKTIKIRNLGRETSTKIVYEQRPDLPAYVAIHIDDNLMEHVLCHVQNGSLIIRAASGIMMEPSRCTIYTNSRTLADLQTSGKVIAEFNTPVTSEKLSISLTGQSELTTQSISATIFSVEIKGGSRMAITGKLEGRMIAWDITGKESRGTTQELFAEYLTFNSDGESTSTIYTGRSRNMQINMKGKSTLQAKELIGQTVICDTRGESKLWVYGSENLDMNASGMSEINYNRSSIVRVKEALGASMIKPVR